MKKIFLTIANYIKQHPRTDIIIVTIGLAVFVTIALLNVTRASFWFDEAFSAYLAQFSYWDIARFTSTDVHPPLYYWLLKAWSSVFGTTELAYRSLSIAIGAGVIAATFALARRLFGRKIAWLTLLFLSISPMLIRYSDEARMYTLSTLIVVVATYVLVWARASQKRSPWIVYGVLVSLGMWTHYFTALAWLAHWVWVGIEAWQKSPRIKDALKKVFTQNWVIAYGLAIALYLPWLPFMAKQLGVVQGAGFWIGQVGAYTPANYLSNYFYYLEQHQALGWLALLLIGVVVAIILLLPRTLKVLKKSEKSSFLLVSTLAWAPPVLLFLASLPPLRSSFVERYLLPAYVALSLFIAVICIVGTRKWKPFWRLVLPITVAGMMIFGITNVYYYGNYNKNSNTHILTREAVELAQKNSPVGTPIIANSPWIFYEASVYNTEDHPIYFIDANTRYDFGSLDMLKYSDMHKIKDLAAFVREHPTIWYLGSTKDEDIAPYDESWQRIKTVGAYDHIHNETLYKATLYRTISE